MSTAIISTDINIGPFKIPNNGQNMITNNYAERNNLVVELMIPEPMMSNALATTMWIHHDIKLDKVILCSIHQLPVKQDRIETLLKKHTRLDFTEKIMIPKEWEVLRKEAYPIFKTLNIFYGELRLIDFNDYILR